MDYELLKKANETIETTDIKGKKYCEVNQRIKAFRFAFPMGRIQTELVSLENNMCIFRASVYDEVDHLLGTGTAYEKEGAGFINQTSYIENCETSAVGRALGMCGFGVDASLASVEEIKNTETAPVPMEELKKKSKKEQKSKEDAEIEEVKLRSKIIAYVERHNLDEGKINQICKYYKVDDLHSMTMENCKNYIASLEKNGGNIDE